jgi:hypothetical protein
MNNGFQGMGVGSLPFCCCSLLWQHRRNAAYSLNQQAGPFDPASRSKGPLFLVSIGLDSTRGFGR